MGACRCSFKLFEANFVGSPLSSHIMVRELSQPGGSILDSDDQVLAFLQKCLDVLEHKSIVKECFMIWVYFLKIRLSPFLPSLISGQKCITYLKSSVHCHISTT